MEDMQHKKQSHESHQSHRTHLDAQQNADGAGGGLLEVSSLDELVRRLEVHAVVSMIAQPGTLYKVFGEDENSTPQRKGNFGECH